MPFEFLRLPFVALVGFLVYAEDFEAAVLIGAVLIFAGNYVSLRQESRRLT
jgi:drug/metabolite transporter (DMT)-like permease